MNHPLLQVFGVVLLANFFSGCETAPPVGRGGGSGTALPKASVVVVDMQKVFNSLRERREIEAALSLKRGMENREREAMSHIEALYRKVLRGVESYARENQYDLVLYKESARPEKAANQQQMAAVVQTRKVLYASNELDITDPIIQRLNKEFDNAAGAEAPTRAAE